MIKVILITLNILFLTAAAYFAIDTAYDLLLAKMSSFRPVDTVSQAVGSLQKKKALPFGHYQPIISRNLFNSKSGETTKKPAADDVLLDKLEKTELRLKLWGTVAMAGNESYAVIESEKERKQNLYRVGDSVESASVKMILREKVVLTVNGTDEILELEKPVSGVAVSGNLVQPASRKPMPGLSGGVSKRRITLRRAQVESAMGNLGELMGQAKIEPHADGGLLVSNIKPNSLFRRMGLRNGDIITGVDGNRIETVDDAMKLYNNLKTSESASVDITRRGRKQNIEYKIK